MARRLQEVPDYFLVPRWTLESAQEHGLLPADILTFVTMCSLSNRDAEVEVSQLQIVEATGLSRSSVKRALPRLLRAEFIRLLEEASPYHARRYGIARVKPLKPIPVGYPTANAKVTQGGWLEAI